MVIHPHTAMSDTLIKLEIYSHGVRVSNYSRELLLKLSSFFKDLELRELVRQPRGGMTSELKKVFYGMTEDRRSFFIHIRNLSGLLSALKARGIPEERIEKIQVPVPESESAELILFDHFVLHDYQVPIVAQLEDDTPSRRLDLFTGYGKAGTLDSKIKVPGGWTTMGAIQVGDIITAADGTTAKVTGVYPQGIKPFYVITTVSGRKTYACAEHLWMSYNGGSEHGEYWDIRDTRELRALITEDDDHDVHIPIYKGEYEPGLFSNPNVTDNGCSPTGIMREKIRSIELGGEAECQCISIDHPDRLYVTDDFIVTHNTLSALAASGRRAQRTIIMIPPKYFGIWIKALRETYKDIEGRYCTVSGSGELKALMELAIDDDFPFDVIIVSMVTYRNYIDAYEKYGEDIVELGYPVPPPRFHELLKVGIQINDEFQEDPGLVFRIDIYTNIQKQIYLSATPYTGSPFVTKMIDVMLPPETCCELPEYKPYINVVALLYYDTKVQPKDYLTPYKNTYNHTRYEKQLLKNKKRLVPYLNNIKRVVYGAYVSDRVPGQKLLILCALVDFIHHLTKFLQKEFPDLQIGAHVSGSDYSKLMTNDITVSTIKSSGTGVDIKDLREVILCQAVDSKKDNIQLMGRLRPLKSFPDVSPRLTYLVCEQIPQHKRYHMSKKTYFQGRALSHRTMRL